MLKIKNIITAFVVLTAAALVACEKADERPNRSDNTITLIYANSIPNTNGAILGEINGNNIYFNIPQNRVSEFDLTQMFVWVETIIIDATYSPPLTGRQDISSAKSFTVTAGNGAQRTYTMVARVQ